MQIRMLREIDAMFADVPQSRKTLEVKEEMLQNLTEKFNDLVAEGKSEEAAFNIAIGSIGDISDLIAELQQPIPKVASFPEPDLSDYDGYAEEAPMHGEEAVKHQKAATVSLAVMLYILSPIALLVFGGKLGLILLFLMLAAATGILVYYGMTQGGRKTRAGQADEPLDEEAQRKLSKEQKKLLSSVSSALWLIVVALYFVISFATHAWHITWIIFLIAAAANNVLRAFVDMYRSR